MALGDLHDDEIKARLGLDLGDTMEDRIVAHALRAMPEDFDPETEVELELLDMTKERGGDDQHRGNPGGARD
ncbi:hypothetical protein I5G58_gp074 [Mycobacterium phage BirdsNest]|uniref:Uncharacterized protein n=1 Tax=Mycobacterium phage BirdsNest TaxID=2686231 RepID=A0A6B9L705_9CAUD|nr:hypothetical protein I5G58_gp074 [Mycobacterium phage BirdsNest]QHB37376.1 hypothetical protein PBI_BIRDSNEST_74 [Mycobacterium phage BirdsNest]